MLLLIFPGAGTATAVSTAADAFQGDAFQAPDAFQATPAAAPIQPSASVDQGGGVEMHWRRDFAPSRKKLRKSVEEAEVARAAESGVIAFEGDDWSDEEILLLLELV